MRLGKNAPGVELDNPDSRGRAVEDQEDRRRHQDARSARGHDPRREADAVAGLEHRRKGEESHQGHAAPQ